VGEPTQVLPYVTAGALGMAIENNGDMLVMSGGGDVIQVNPVDQMQQTILQLSQQLPGQGFAKIAVDPITNDIFFDSSLNGESFIYRINPDGSDLTEIASDVDSVSGFTGLAIGPSGDGSGETSIYATDPGTSEIVEIRPVPEPASISVLLLTGGVLAIRRRRGIV
jgi:hypothetical protein